MLKNAFLSLALITAGPVLGDTISVELDASKMEPAVSKYLYGQFTEHAGESIYGGLWSEMLEDRKFFYSPSSAYDPWGTTQDRGWNSGPFQYLRASPWKLIGPPQTVSMDNDHPYTGKHSPIIHLTGDNQSAGISQEGLSLATGKKYAGRIVLSGDAAAAPVIIQLVTDGGLIASITIDKLTDKFATYPFELSAPATSENAHLDILSKGSGTFEIGAVSLMPADNVHGWRADTLALLKELDSPIYRWPGGNFVSGYHWQDGIGDRDKRSPKKNPAWHSLESNDVGLDEFMDLLSMVHAEPFVALNLGTGTVEEAAQEVEYMIGGSETSMGRLRAKNGHPEPYTGKYWAVGNEMFGTWQLGYMPLKDYIVKQNQAAEAIRKLDPTAQLVASGVPGAWNEGMYKGAADHMNFMSDHTYSREKPDADAHIQQIAQSIKRITDAERKYRDTLPELKGKKIPIVLDEWGYWYGPYKYGELGVQYHFKDALGLTMGLHELYRNSDLIFMANYAQTVNVLGAIKTSPTTACMDMPGLVLSLYRHQFGTIPIEIAKQPSADLDISAAWTEDHSAITLSIVNHSKNSHEIALDLGAQAVKQTCTQFELKSENLEALNEPGKTPAVKVEKREGASSKVLLSPAYSVELYRIDRQ